MLFEVIHTTQNIVFKCAKAYLGNVIQIIEAMQLTIDDIKHDVEDNEVDYSKKENPFKGGEFYNG